MTTETPLPGHMPTAAAAVAAIFAGLIPEAEYARLAKRSQRQIQRDRAAGRGPKVTWLGRSPYYQVEAIQEWLLSQEREPSARPPEPPRAPRVNGQRTAPRSPTDVCKIPWCTEPVVPRAGPGPRNRYCAEHIEINARRRAAARAAP